MRNTFIKTLTELAAGDPRIVLLTGDLGYTVVEPFAETYPERFFNVGVAEQNMLGLAAGLAESGYLPFVYSIATFASMRGYEFFRNGAALQRLPVRVIGVGGGFEYGSAGPTHFALEDVGIMRLQPDVAIVAPADYEQARSALLRSWDMPQPIYYRLGKNERNVIPGLEGRFELGRLQIVRDGSDLAIVAMGAIATEAFAAASQLDCALAIAASISPAPVDDLVRFLERYRTVMTVEAHYATGGLASLVSEIVAERGLHCRVIARGVRHTPEAATGSESYMHRLHGLDCNSLVGAAGKVAV